VEEEAVGDAGFAPEADVCDWNEGGIEVQVVAVEEPDLEHSDSDSLAVGITPEPKRKLTFSPPNSNGSLESARAVW